MNVTQLSYSINEYKNLYEAGELSKDEYKDLLEGLKLEEVIHDTEEELKLKIGLQANITLALKGSISGSVMPEDYNQLKLEVGLLKGEFQQVSKLTEKISVSIEKIQELNVNVLQMLTAHEEKHESQIRYRAQ